MEKEREKKSEKEDSYFDPDGTWKGLAVVITNFLSGPHIRKGAEKDPESMKKSFEQLGFKVICHEDVTKPKLLTDLLDEYSKKTDLDCFALAISSHGCEMEKKEDKKSKKEKGEKEKNEKKIKQHAIKMFDGKFVFTHEILDHFSDENCPGLRNKPKIFLIQACRIPDSQSTDDHKNVGIGYDEGCSLPKDTKSNPAEPNPVKPDPQTSIDYYPPDATNKKASSVEDQDEIDSPKPQILSPPDLVEITFVPCYNDMLIMFPCPEDHYAIRNMICGSYMITLFSKSVDAWYTRSKPANLMDMLRDVTYNMSIMTFHGSKEYKCLPCIVHKLKKGIIFNRRNT